jgi:heme-degrading monooxygenase HmoA
VPYVFMAIHYPEPGRQADLYRRMATMAESIAGTPGLIDIGPWLEHDGERVVGVSRWESREAFEAAMPGSGVPSETVHEWEARPREYLHLTQPAR